MFGMSGFTATIAGQTTRLAPRRATTMSGQTVVCDEMATTAFYLFKIDLAPHAVAVETSPRRGRGDDRADKAGKIGARPRPRLTSFIENPGP
jgi:hypothetical protein